MPRLGIAAVDAVVDGEVLFDVKGADSALLQLTTTKRRSMFFGRGLFQSGRHNKSVCIPPVLAEKADNTGVTRVPLRK